MKKQVKNADDLARAIVELERKAAEQKRDIQETFAAVSEGLKPLNLVKSGFRSVLSGEHNEDIVNALIGMGTGFISRKLLLGKSHGFISKTVGKAVQWGMAGLVSKNAEIIKDKAAVIIDRLFKKNKPSPADNQKPFISESSKYTH